MDENIPTQPPQPIVTPVPVQFSKKSNLVVILLTVLLLVSISISVFLALQVRNLTKQLAEFRLQVQTTPTPTLDPTANWKTYTNNLYTFRIKYPEKFNLAEDTNKKDFYDDLASLTFQDTSINIKAIYNIDVYKNSKTRDVAEREVVDSGFKYNITDTTISGYAVAITVLETTPKFHTIATIANPNKNLFVQISSDTDRTELDQILSTFKFSGQTSALVPADSQTPAAGICNVTTDSVVVVTVGLDNVSIPRCVKVTSNQRLRIVNNSNDVIPINVGSYQTSIQINGSYEFPATLGSFLAPGVHFVVGEIWLQ